MSIIPFSKPTNLGTELEYLQQALENGKLSGDGAFTKKCSQWLETYFQTPKVLLTTSCTHALEMAAILLEIAPGDEVILPSFTFVSTANAFVLRGAKLVFVDIDPQSMNSTAQNIEAAITSYTKAIVPVHYGGWCSDLDNICSLASNYGIPVVEDAAQALRSTFNDRPLGGIGSLGCISFHDTKNIHCGEGGALIVNDSKYVTRAEVIREKGTNRANFLRGQVDKYTWVDIGSSYLPSEFNAAALLPQLLESEKITNKRLDLWTRYHKNLSSDFETPFISRHVRHNGHMFYIKCNDIEHRCRIIEHLKCYNISAAFHYLPLHSTSMGRQHGRHSGNLTHTDAESSRLLRLPLFYSMTNSDVDRVCEVLRDF